MQRDFTINVYIFSSQVLDIYGDGQRKETRNRHGSQLLRCLKDDDEEVYVGLPFTITKKPIIRPRQTRKGVPLRAPMF